MIGAAAATSPASSMPASSTTARAASGSARPAGSGRARAGAAGPGTPGNAGRPGRAAGHGIRQDPGQGTRPGRGAARPAPGMPTSPIWQATPGQAAPGQGQGAPGQAGFGQAAVRAGRAGRRSDAAGRREPSDARAMGRPQARRAGLPGRAVRLQLHVVRDHQDHQGALRPDHGAGLAQRAGVHDQRVPVEHGVRPAGAGHRGPAVHHHRDGVLAAGPGGVRGGVPDRRRHPGAARARRSLIAGWLAPRRRSGDSCAVPVSASATAG